MEAKSAAPKKRPKSRQKSRQGRGEGRGGKGKEGTVTAAGKATALAKHRLLVMGFGSKWG